MSDDERDEEAGEEEEAEERIFWDREWEFTPDDVIKALDDGPKTYIVGGPSKQSSVQGALEQMKADHEQVGNWLKALQAAMEDGECMLRDGGKAWPALAAQKLVLVKEGEYAERVSLTDNAVHGGVSIIGDGEASAIVVSKGMLLGLSEATVCGITFAAGDGNPALSVCCPPEDKSGVRAEVTGCYFRGGRTVAEFHPWVEPVLTACSFAGLPAEEGGEASVVGVHCHAQSRATLRSGLVTLQQCPFRKAKEGQKEVPASKDGGPKSSMVPAGDAVWLDRHEEEGGGDGTKWSRVRWRGVDGHVPKRALRYEAPRACDVTGTGAPGTVGVYCDDALCCVSGAHVTRHQTGCYMKEACREGGNTHNSWAGRAHAQLDGCTIEDIAGTGLYLADGCRAAVRACRVRRCEHYALLVAASPQPDTAAARVCSEVESALLRGDGHAPESSDERRKLGELQAKAEQHGWQSSGAARFYAGDRFCAKSRVWKTAQQEGVWAPPETRPLLRGNVLNGNVKVQSGAFPTFFDNCVVGKGMVARMDAVLAVSTSPGGLKALAEEPKIKPLKREEEEEEEG